ncbi:MAG: GTP 3',8-cyclase MoaA [bacterium]
MLVDNFGRHIDYLRLSITDRCDLRCSYCMSEKMTFLPKRDLLNLEELYTLSKSFINRGIRHIRITGGEPLVRRDALFLLEKLSSHLGADLDELTITTNATQLAKFAPRLAELGIKRINVSLDTLERATYATLTRRDMLPQVLDGINVALAEGIKIKLNTVALKNANRQHIPDMVEWAHQRNMEMTLIEVMPLGETGEDRVDQFLPLDEVRQDLEQRWTLIPSDKKTGGPARYITIAETGGTLGLITPLSQNFCAGCNRVRVTCTGKIYMCLGHDDHLDLRAALRGDTPQDSLNALIDRAMMRKPEKHHFEITKTSANAHLSRHMSVTGG